MFTFKLQAICNNPWSKKFLTNVAFAGDVIASFGEGGWVGKCENNKQKIEKQKDFI